MSEVLAMSTPAVWAHDPNSAVQNVRTFNQWADDFYGTGAAAYYDAVFARLLRALNLTPGDELLDAGCGTGVHSIRAARAGYHVQAIDISQAALNIAARKVNQAGVSTRVQMENGSVTELPYEDGRFRAAFSWGVLAHIPPVDAALQELVRVVAPGGRLALQVTNQHALDHTIEASARFALRKPMAGAVHRQWGIGWTSGNTDGDDGTLWTWRHHIPAIVTSMEQCGCRLVEHSAAEFTEMQRRLPMCMRFLPRWMNRMYAAMHLPARYACTNLLIFEKCKQPVATRSSL